jgi:hypothetical protein
MVGSQHVPRLDHTLQHTQAPVGIRRVEARRIGASIGEVEAGDRRPVSYGANAFGHEHQTLAVGARLASSKTMSSMWPSAT